jgi:hypothetical protein
MLQASFSVDITPNFPVELGGYKETRKNVTEVLDRIEVNCLILKKDSEFLVIMSFDLLYVGLELRSKLEEALLQFGVESKNLFLCASHTHHSPMVDPSKPLLGNIDRNYLDWLISKVIWEFRSTLRSEFLPFVAELGYGNSKLGIGRRAQRVKVARRGLIFFGGFVMKPNPAYEIDRTLRRLSLKTPETGETLLELWSFGVHATARKRGRYISADFPGRVRANIRKEAQSNIPVLFLQGFSADVRPNSSLNHSIVSWVKAIINGGSFQEFSDREYCSWGDELSAELLSIETVPIPNFSYRAFEVHRIPINSNLFIQDVSETGQFFIHIVFFSFFAFVGVPAEVASAYAIKKRGGGFNARNLWPSGCIDHVIAYVPTSAMITEGGYEADGFRKYFGCGPVQVNIEAELNLIFENI